MKKMQIIPSKSDAHRALICAALSEKPCRVICETTSKDIEATKKCLAALKQGEEAMYCGESGSTLRFLLPVMGAKGHKAAFYPEGRLPQRPLSPLYEELTAHGCRLSPQGSVPLTIEGQLQAGVYTLPGNVSSQYISGLLFALPMLEGDSELHIQGFMESAPYVDMTATTLTQFGIRIEKTEYGYHIILKVNSKEGEALKKVKDEVTKALAEEELRADSTLSVTAWDKLRNKYNLKINDKKIKKSYEEVINSYK